MSGASWTVIGPIDRFGSDPTPVVAGGATWFVVRHGPAIRVLSTVCPHQGGTIEDRGTRFACPVHGWTFDRDTGRSLNAPSRAMKSVPVRVEDGVLFALVPGHDAAGAGAAGVRPKPGLTVQLH